MIPILMYHQIDTRPPDGAAYGDLIVSPAMFRREMSWLRRLGFRGLSIRDVLPYLNGRKRGSVAAITFDDGYRNVYRHALPVLLDHGFTATNYFVARQVGGTNAWDHDKGIPPAELMSAEEIRDWVRQGMEAGSHTLDHPYLPKLDEDSAQEQIVLSRRLLEQVVQAPVLAFSFPYGGENERLREMVRGAGYTSATTTLRGRACPADDLFRLPRVTVEGSVSTFRFLLSLYSLQPAA